MGADSSYTALAERQRQQAIISVSDQHMSIHVVLADALTSDTIVVMEPATPKSGASSPIVASKPILVADGGFV